MPLVMPRLMRAPVLCGLPLALAACVAAPADPAGPAAPVTPVARADIGAALAPVAGGGIAVSRTAPPAYAMWDGAAARRDADALCGPRGVRSSIRDRYQAGAWIFVGGCA